VVLLSINILLVILFILSLLIIGESYEISHQIGLYNFGIDQVYVAWKRDFLLDSGTSLMMGILLIFLYDQTFRIKEGFDKKKRCSIAAEKLLNVYYAYLLIYLAIDKTFNLLNDNYQICTIDTFRDNFNF
jgi:hypothetical protein